MGEMKRNQDVFEGLVKSKWERPKTLTLKGYIIAPNTI